MYDLLLKGGEVVDPAQGIHEILDVAIQNGKIAAVQKDIALSEARKVIPLRGKLLTPGLIDVHCHCASSLAPYFVDPDDIGLQSGVTLLCDGGSCGAANFHTLRQYNANISKTDVLCFVNLALCGLVNLPEIVSEHDISPTATKKVVEENRDIIRGIKLRATEALVQSVGMKAVEIAKKLSDEVNLPLMLHIGEPRDRTVGDSMDKFTREAVGLMDKGDVLSHFMTLGAGGLIQLDGEVAPELPQAQKRGVVLDSSHGMYNFSIRLARHAIQQGLLPTVISTDLSKTGTLVVQSLLVTMSKFINLGLSIDQVVRMTTINPAKVLGEESRHGSLAPGRSADIAVLEVVKGEYLFSDGFGRSSTWGDQLIEPRLVIKDGVELPSFSRYHIPPVYSSLPLNDAVMAATVSRHAE